MLIAAVEPRLLISGPLLGQQLPRLEHQLPVRHRPVLVPGEDGLDGVAEQAVGHALRRVASPEVWSVWQPLIRTPLRGRGTLAAVPA